ncbi:hypothetical protein A3K72_04270 [Candidatus Woesearchaeota archaeon RBG_13_36_6]|nr:MAG: hypothetical protein A3K72_04270 [Candidatus Woesearchaeota archaeon RBG_13_36_6]
MGRGKLKTAVILAGGLGTRLRPLTLKKPKALLPLQGKPIVEHIFYWLKLYKINHVVLAVCNLKEQIIDYYKDGSKFGLKIDYLKENVPMGTAGCVKLGKNYLKETFLCSHADEVKDININEWFEFHKKNKALVSIALTKIDNPSAYGVAKMDGDKIIEFVEKPKKGTEPSNLINSGTYIIEPEVLNMIPDGHAMWEYDVFPRIAKLGRLYGFVFPGQWFDIGNMQKYKRCEKLWKGIK